MRKNHFFCISLTFQKCLFTLFALGCSFSSWRTSGSSSPRRSPQLAWGTGRAIPLRDLSIALPFMTFQLSRQRVFTTPMTKLGPGYFQEGQLAEKDHDSMSGVARPDLAPLGVVLGHLPQTWAWSWDMNLSYLSASKDANQINYPERRTSFLDHFNHFWLFSGLSVCPKSRVLGNKIQLLSNYAFGRLRLTYEVDLALFPGKKQHFR